MAVRFSPSDKTGILKWLEEHRGLVLSNITDTLTHEFMTSIFGTRDLEIDDVCLIGEVLKRLYQHDYDGYKKGCFAQETVRDVIKTLYTHL